MSEPTFCGYTARELLDLERAAREARDTLAEVVTLAHAATHESKFRTCAEIARQAQIALGQLNAVELL